MPASSDTPIRSDDAAKWRATRRANASRLSRGWRTDSYRKRWRFDTVASPDNHWLVRRRHPYAVHALAVLPEDPLPAVTVLVHVAGHAVRERDAADDAGLGAVAHVLTPLHPSNGLPMPNLIRFCVTDC